MEPVAIAVSTEGAQGIKETLSEQSCKAIGGYLEKLDMIGKAHVELREKLKGAGTCPDMSMMCSAIGDFTKLVTDAETCFKSHRECDVALGSPIPCLVNNDGVQEMGQIIGLSPVAITYFGGKSKAQKIVGYDKLHVGGKKLGRRMR